MLDLNTLRKNHEEIINRLLVKNFDAKTLIEELLEFDKQKREIQVENDALLNKRNRVSKEIGELFKAGKAEERNGLLINKRLLVPDLSVDGMVREDILMVELKAPGNKLGQADHRLAQAYLKTVMKNSQITGNNLRWRLYMIADGTEPYMREQRKNAQSKGKPFLIQTHRSFDIFVCTWRELFTLSAEQQRFALAGQSLKRNDLELALLSRGVKL